MSVRNVAIALHPFRRGRDIRMSNIEKSNPENTPRRRTERGAEANSGRNAQVRRSPRPIDAERPRGSDASGQDRQQRRTARHEEDSRPRGSRPSGSRRSSGAPGRSGNRYPVGRRRKRRVSPLRVLGNWLRAALIAVLIAVVLRVFVFDVVWIGGASMGEALRAGDAVLVTKFDYWTSTPRQGDIIAYVPNGSAEAYIKRVIAIPGQKIEINAGYTLINDAPLSESYVTREDDKSYAAIQLQGNEYYCMGDDRKASADSRQHGPVTGGQVKGKARIILWPLNRIGAVE